MSTNQEINIFLCVSQSEASTHLTRPGQVSVDCKIQDNLPLHLVQLLLISAASQDVGDCVDNILDDCV